MTWMTETHSRVKTVYIYLIYVGLLSKEYTV
jgi:hypothetical protein